MRFGAKMGPHRLALMSRSLGALLVLLCALNAAPDPEAFAQGVEGRGGRPGLSAVGQILAGQATADISQVPVLDAVDPDVPLPSQLDDALERATRQAPSSIPMDTVAREVILEVYDLIDSNYLDARNSGFNHDKWARLRDEALARSYKDRGQLYKALKEMIARGCGDPYSRYIPPSDFASIIKYDVSGVGMNLGSPEDYVKKAAKKLPPGRSDKEGVYVVGLLSSSEAAKAGVEQGDQIVAVDGRSVGPDLDPFQISSAIHGSDADLASGLKQVRVTVRKLDGSQVTVGLQRPGPKVIPSPVAFRVESIQGKKVGYIKLRSFNNRAEPDMRLAVLELERQGVESYAIDIRGNGGGVVSEGVEVAKLFLGADVPVLKVQDRAGVQESILSNPAGPVTTKPIVLLVNEQTASAAEIMAGALRDNCRVALVGGKTFGKGLMQSVYQLQDGSGVVLTTMRYYTPAGVDIDRTGIAPDFQRIPTLDQLQELLGSCRAP